MTDKLTDEQKEAIEAITKVIKDAVRNDRCVMVISECDTKGMYNMTGWGESADCVIAAVGMALMTDDEQEKLYVTSNIANMIKDHYNGISDAQIVH